MNALSWLDSLPDPIRQTLIGAAGDFSGGLAAQAVAALAGMASGQVRKRSSAPKPSRLPCTGPWPRRWP